MTSPSLSTATPLMITFALEYARLGWHVFRVTNDDVDKRFEETVRHLRKRISHAT
jgi:hypothetical protein